MRIFTQTLARQPISASLSSFHLDSRLIDSICKYIFRTLDRIDLAEAYGRHTSNAATLCVRASKMKNVLPSKASLSCACYIRQLCPNRVVCFFQLIAHIFYDCWGLRVCCGGSAACARRFFRLCADHISFDFPWYRRSHSRAVE